MNMIISTVDIIKCISDAIDMISPAVQNHHRRVASISHAIGEACGLQPAKMENLLVAAAMHDMGALTLKQRLDIMRFEGHENQHTVYGAELIQKFPPFAHIAPIIAHHHTPWIKIAKHELEGEAVPIESQIIAVADRVAVLVNDQLTLDQTGDIIKRIDGRAGDDLNPDLVSIFHDVARRESFWLTAIGAVVQPMFRDTLANNLHLTPENLAAFGAMFRQIIDFRSPFTAAHSSGVSAVAQALAELCGFSKAECTLMRVAGDLHDIGKLTVPEAILQKPSGLTASQANIMRQHTYYTDQILINIKAFDGIRKWAALHHERLNGQGYPFRLSSDNIPLGSRIMAVADIYTAITEDRPYRKGMDPKSVLNILNGMVKNGSIDAGIVKLVAEHQDRIDRIRIAAQEAAQEEYQAFINNPAFSQSR